MTGLQNFAMVTSPNGNGVVVIGGEFCKTFEKRFSDRKAAAKARASRDGTVCKSEFRVNLRSPASEKCKMFSL